MEAAIDDIYKFPLTERATDRINDHLRLGVSDDQLAELVLVLRSDDALVVKFDDGADAEPRIVCSMGLVP